MATTSAPLPEGVIKVDGMLWKPKPGATATAEEFTAARTSFREINRDGRWNPWVLDERRAELDEAMAIMDQWTRAEPGHRRLTMKQMEARWEREDRRLERERAAADKQREARKKHYDPERAQARLSLLEDQSFFEHLQTELVAFRDGSRSPGMESIKRQKEMAELETKIESAQKSVKRLEAEVGDPEEVIDENGWLPSERRDDLLLQYKYDREFAVRDLRKQLAELQSAYKASKDRKERSDLRSKISISQRKIDDLLAVPELAAEQMCSECATPMFKHGWVTPPYDGPCPAWPGWAKQIQRAREILRTAAEANKRDKKPPVPPPPKPEPLAIIPSGLPIAEITARLTELQKQFPDAEVRRGRANRWELWPAKR
ncbi:hypothetical protein [Actinomadura sp. WMMB 499]|uniref:hypothetical protein n=1 Tax=Actinomadura sp. WMMB 499 TaxID=1219491 RepID=UPI00124401C6|nr:hypothetical protein [Actinomadura sp. WMMB 499]QFG23725.1 hypothetical protein F7P10_23965 [Actinomadura sp. WMMB 499]